MMIIHASGLIATGTAGFVLSGAAGAAVGVGAYAVVRIAWFLVTVSAQDLALVLPEPVKPQQFSAYEDLDDVIDSLEELAQERNWDPDKRFDIARMACEYPTMTMEELERRYDDRAKDKA